MLSVEVSGSRLGGWRLGVRNHRLQLNHGGKIGSRASNAPQITHNFDFGVREYIHP